jgi:predicted dehydrogenase
MAEKTQDDYALKGKGAKDHIAAPVLPYQPRDPKSYQPNIGLIGCGGITQAHLGAYREAGYNVVALCDLTLANAEKRRDEFFPNAEVYTDSEQVLARDDIQVVDIATHPPERVPLIRRALESKKHVLSQKPFVLDLDTGVELAGLADAQGVRLAVNQNGRWSPHFSYIREATRAGHIGDLMSLHARVHWDHTWIAGTPFERIRDVVLYDFAIHWFDFAATILSASDARATKIYASRSRAAGQSIEPPMLAQVVFEFEGVNGASHGQASLVFDAALPFGSRDETLIGGTRGTLYSTGPDLGDQTVTLTTEAGVASPTLEGKWFNGGFHGTMGELLCAIEENREPQNSARNNLNSLALCFAAIASASDGEPKTSGQVRALPPGSAPMATAAGH